MEFYQLEQFSAIAKSKTMREAAARLHLSQPTLSQNLKKLESELGCKLFDRSHNRMELTNVGQILLERCDHMVADWHETLAAIAAEKQRQAQTVLVGCYSTVHCFFSMPQLAISFPHLNFEVWVREVADVVEGYESGIYDLIIVPDVPITKRLGLVPIDEERVYLSVPKSSPLARKSALEFSDLAGQQLIVPDDICGLSPWYKHIVDTAGVDPLLVEYASTEDYLNKLDSTLKCHFSTTLMQQLTNSGTQRVDLPIMGDEASRMVCLAAHADDAKTEKVVSFLKRNRSNTISGHAFLPLVLKQGNLSNLLVHEEER